MLGRVSLRARFVLAAAFAALPLLALVAYSAADRYRADRARAETRAASRAELYAALLARSGARIPTSGELDALARLSAPTAGSALAVYERGRVVARTGVPRAEPPPGEPHLTNALARPQAVFRARGADGAVRLWGTHRVEHSPLVVAFGFPGSSVYGAALTALRRDVGLALVAVLAALAAAFFAAGRVTAPIRRLAARVGANGGADEVERLEQGFSRGELELARRAERLAALHAIDRAILDADSPEDVAAGALGRLRALVGARRAEVVRFGHDRPTSLAVDADDGSAAPSGADELDGDLPVGEPRVRGNRVVMPLAAEAELLGAVLLDFDRPDDVTEDVLVAVREVADQLAIALRHAGLHAELRAVLDGAMDAIVVLDSERRFVSANAGAARIYDLPTEAVIGRRLDDFVGRRRAEADWHAFLAQGAVDTVWEGDHGNGVRSLEIRGRAEFLPGRHLFVLRDVTQQRKLEDQLRQAQKMEAIGQLAGGVAHDFNNLLTVIGGYSQLARRRIGAGPGANELAEVERATERATALTRQLLAFSRRQLLNPSLLDLNEVLSALIPMLDRLIGDDTSVAMLAVDDLPRVRADRAQIEQVVINLAVNARDAMPSGGTLTIETRAVLLDERYAAEHADARAGRYVCITVADTGVGMDRETLEHIFEPFFTTKEPGQGTGLGLATVHGIVTQSQGHVAVYSEPGFGTTFKIYLPAVTAGVASASAETAAAPEALDGSETVLLCEDDDRVRQLVETVLSAHGYRLLTAARPSEALALARGGEPIDVLVSDVIMPEMPGPELARRLQELLPDLPILFVSGYTAETVRGRGALPPGSTFLEKPFDEASLLRALRALLDGPPRPHPDADGAASPEGSTRGEA